MTSEQIVAMDHDALAYMAYMAGLAPASTVRHADGTYWCEEGAQRQWVAWKPWEVLAQADEIFRQLRARRWDTFQGYDDAQQFGHVTAFKPSATATVECQWRLAEQQTEEPLALLRCAVLATANDLGKDAT